MDMIQSTGAPAAIGPYSQAVDTGSTVYLSGQIGQDPASGQIVTGFKAQTIPVSYTHLTLPTSITV